MRGPEVVVRSTSPRDESGDEKRPRSAYGRQRTRGVGERQVVDLNPVGEDAEHDTGDPKRDLDRAHPHARIVTRARA